MHPPCYNPGDPNDCRKGRSIVFQHPFRFILAALIVSAGTGVQAENGAIPPPPPIAAAAYILIDANSGRVLAEQNADTQLEPASLTKMMTAYITFGELS